MKIYTRTGDGGETSLFGGMRVSKSDPRVAAYGDVDELNALIGTARGVATDPELDAELLAVQRELFGLGAQLADPAEKIASHVNKAILAETNVRRLEQLIDRFEAELPPLRHFILAGGNACGAALHVARAVCRRAERGIVALEPAVDPVLLEYINRLSDLLFVMARIANLRSGAVELPW